MTQTLEPAEMSALMEAAGADPASAGGGAQQIFSRCRKDFENVEIRAYDFKRPERISPEQMRALQTLHENYVRGLMAFLSGYLRTIVEVRVAGVEQMTYEEFIAGLPNPTCFNVLSAPELNGPMCLEISPLVVYPIIDRLLGGSGQHLFIPQREMTPIEVRLVRTILDQTMGCLCDAWAGVHPVTLTLGQMQSNPQIPQIAPPNEVVVVIRFEVKLGVRAGTMSLCIPFSSIEHLVASLNARSWSQSGRPVTEDQWRSRITEQLIGARVPLAGILATTTITLSELGRLEVGDVIMTEKPATAPAVLTVAGKPKFLVGLGQYRGHKALRILRRVEPGDRSLPRSPC